MSTQAINNAVTDAYYKMPAQTLAPAEEEAPPPPPPPEAVEPPPPPPEESREVSMEASTMQSVLPGSRQWQA